VIASPLAYSSCRRGLASVAAPMALSPPLRPLTRALLARRARRAPCWDAILGYLQATGDPWPAQAGLRASCPPREVLEALAGAGYYEPVASAAARGCEVPRELAEQAIDFLVLAGRGDKARALGLAARPRVVAVYCGGGVVEAWDGERLYSSRGLSEAARSRLAAQADAGAIAWGLGAQAAVSWGCPGGVSLEALRAEAYPEVPPSLEALKHHLALPEVPAPALVAGAAARAAETLLRSGAHVYSSVPRHTLETLASAPAPKGRCPAPPHPIVTDKPRLGCPYWSPRIVDASKVEASGPPAAAALSLAHRGGDPGLALRWGPEGLADAIEGAVVENREPAGPGVQVRPPHARAAGVGKPRALDCLRPEWMCLREAGFPAAPAPGRVEVLDYSVEAESVVDAARAALAAWPGSVLVAPSRAAAKLVAASLGLPLLEDPASWDHAGGGVVSWETLRDSAPWLAARGAVALFPESWPGSPETPEGLASLAYAVAGRAVSRGLLAWARHGVVVAVAAPEGDWGGRGVLPEDLAVEAVEEEFQRMWRGYTMRPYQRVAAATVLHAAYNTPLHPVMVVLPTGSGKSAVFLSAGMAAKRLGLGGYVLVVSPLRALMRDQVEGASRRGLLAARLDASVPRRARRRALEAAKLGLIDVVYATPERLQDPETVEVIASQPPAAAVLDEAHSVHRWGRSFRPGYLHAARLLGELAREAGAPHISLYTATAPPALARDVVELVAPGGEPVEHPLPLEDPEPPRLPLSSPIVLRGPVLRPEISFDVLPAEDGEERLRQAAAIVSELAAWADSQGGPWLGVVYTGFVRSQAEWANADRVAEALYELTGIPTVSYHGQLPPSERRRREDEIYEASRGGPGPRIVVATKAFGMGVDIPNIRWVLHYTLSTSIEDYYQEVGRAARDGRPAKAIALYSRNDASTLAGLVKRSRVKPSHVVRLYNSLAGLYAAARKTTGAHQLIVVPEGVLGPGGLRALDAAARLGLLDYWSERTQLAAYRFPRGLEPSDYMPWYMEVSPGIVVGPETRAADRVAERKPLSFYRCATVGPWTAPLAVEAGSSRLAAGECMEWLKYKPAREPVAVVYWPPESPPEPLQGPPGPREFRLLQRTMHEDEEMIAELAWLLEEALAARKRGGPEAADATIRRGIEEYFSRQPTEPPEPGHIMGRLVTCPRAGDCMDRALEALVSASEWLGDASVTLAAQDEELAEKLLIAYTRETGRPFRGRWKGAYRAVVAASRKGADLLDYGFIVALVRAAPRPSALIERLSGYRYAAVHAYASD